MFRIIDRREFIRSAGHALYREYEKIQTPQFQANMWLMGGTKAVIAVDHIIEIEAERHGVGNIEDVKNKTFAAWKKQSLTEAYELARTLGNEQAKEYFGELLS